MNPASHLVLEVVEVEAEQVGEPRVVAHDELHLVVDWKIWMLLIMSKYDDHFGYCNGDNNDDDKGWNDDDDNVEKSPL